MPPRKASFVLARIITGRCGADIGNDPRLKIGNSSRKILQFCLGRSLIYENQIKSPGLFKYDQTNRNTFKFFLRFIVQVTNMLYSCTLLL